MVSIVVAILAMIFVKVSRPIDSNAGYLLQDAGRIESRGWRVREVYPDDGSGWQRQQKGGIQLCQVGVCSADGLDRYHVSILKYPNEYIRLV